MSSICMPKRHGNKLGLMVKLHAQMFEKTEKL